MAKSIPVEIKFLDNYKPEWGAPEYATEGSNAVDLRAAIPGKMFLFPGQTLLIPAGIAINIQKPGIAMHIIPKSGLGAKKGVIIGNGTGLIDNDYHGQIMVSLWNRNFEGEPFEICPGDFIAQGYFLNLLAADFNVVDEFSRTTDRGEKGFGEATEAKYGKRG